MNTSDLQAMIAGLDPARARQALSVAVNDTARQTLRMAASRIAKESSIKVGAVRKGMAIRPWSTPDTLSATVVGSGKPLPLRDFGARQTRKGVTATVWGKRQMYAGAFIVKGFDHGIGGHAFIRLTRRRLPIKKMFGAGVAQVMAQDHVSAVIVAHGQTRLAVNAQRQLDRYIAGAGGRGR